jgi:crotonobetainyl-CoA:carnitine CoA-transferase CaiB-like acyl-CoA transferase
MTAPPLDGVRVIEAASFVSGPYVGQMLADLGAEVIKVESPLGGDAFRRFGRPDGPYSAVFANTNRGKRSVALDLKDRAGRSALLDLVESSDVWLTNWRPGVADRLDLADEVLVDRNPRLIRVYVTGYGLDGPQADSPVFDTIVQAASGLSHALSSGEQPRLLPGFLVDKLTAAMATQAVLAALFARERTGAGERIDLSMLAAASYVDFLELFSNRTFVASPPAEARNLQATGLRALRTKDGWMVTAPVSGSAIRRVCEVVGHPEWVPELRQLPDQTLVAAELFGRLDGVLPERSTDEWVEMFGAHDVPVARCVTMDEHLSDPQVASQDIYRIEHWDGVGQVRSVRYPASFDSVGRLGAPGPAPHLGQDTARILGRAAEPSVATTAGPEKDDASG